MTRVRSLLIVIAFMFGGLVFNTVLILNATHGVSTNTHGLQRQQQKQALLIKQNRVLAATALREEHEIQRQRYDATYENCAELNARHEGTIKLFRLDLKTAPQQAASQVQQTLAFLNVLVPFRNCVAVAQKVLNQPGPPIPPIPPKGLPPTAAQVLKANPRLVVR